MSKNRNPIIKSWTINADKWIKTIEKEEIESRQLVTNAAILQNILLLNPDNVLDIGCGEGWLVHALTKQGITTTGVDGVKSLIEAAKSKRKGNFEVINYKELSDGVSLKSAPFDLISINFALFENKKTARLIKKLRNYLVDGGNIVIQTLHPFSIDLDGPYKSAWRKDSWKGLKRNFKLPYKWYFRTIEDWITLFRKAGFSLEKLKEPIHPKTGRPASVIFVLKWDKK